MEFLNDPNSEIMKQKKSKARRHFLSLLGLGMMGYSFTTPKDKTNDLEKGETQLMLTADGQLVEVPKELIKNAKRKSVRSNKRLWSWLQKHKEEKK